MVDKDYSSESREISEPNRTLGVSSTSEHEKRDHDLVLEESKYKIFKPRRIIIRAKILYD